MRIFKDIRRHACDNPAKPFLISRGSSLTYGDVLDAAQGLAVRILGMGDLYRPCLIKADRSSACIAILACMSIGKPFVVVNPSSPQQRLAYYLYDSGANVLVHAVASAIALGEQSAESFVVESVSSPDTPWTTVEADGRAACLIYTSGSTGQPKAVVCSERSMSFAVEAINNSLGYEENDVVLSALPIFFDFGMYQFFLAGRVGAQIYFANELENSVGLANVLSQTKATILPMVPPAAEKLAQLVKRGLSPASVRMVTTTGGALAPDVRETLTELWNGRVDVRAMYGLTECKRVAIMPAFQTHVHPKASGTPLDGTTVTIRPHGSNDVLSTGTPGEICVQGPHVMMGYHNQPELTRQRFQPTSAGVVLRTGDTGVIDDAGFVHCLGRTDEQFKVRGYRVSSSEVAFAARSAGDVESVAVVQPRGGTPFTLFFSGAADEATVSRALKQQLEAFSVPTVVKKLPILPRNANGKIDMQDLQKKAGNG